ncbi:MAG: hypothetical protein HFP81_04600 [Methylococcales symbiont of Hymedesmia sp. n. MRB-2018]|nr:MAG: hypothetical protein HFP78_03020 [Methylococcales symbiont of Hymedesmia sp. n. MRB-2018]KAF3983989.1 MAG: hypothetical protein HFP81_04600 [Methylococcales symbiont of Hymedesmia sp. n. MRB-2018]
MNKKQWLRKSFLSILGLLFSSALWAHGGAAGTDTDQCKFELEPDHWIHYTAYQPSSYPGDEFCGNLPDLGTTTLLVFDYQDIRYRNMAVEFEVTKEPEGTVIFKKNAKKHKSGTVNLNIGNIVEAGKYLIHITLLQDSGERLDAHMAFQAGSGKGTSKITLLIYLLVLLAVFYVFYISNAGFKMKVDSFIKSNTSMKE